MPLVRTNERPSSSIQRPKALKDYNCYQVIRLEVSPDNVQHS